MKEKVINSLIIILGNTLLALATSIFILPFNIDNGGLSGISVVLERWFDPAIVIFVLNWVLFFIGLIFLKKDFALKTLISTIVYPLIVNLLYYTKGYHARVIAFIFILYSLFPNQLCPRLSHTPQVPRSLI